MKNFINKLSLGLIIPLLAMIIITGCKDDDEPGTGGGDAPVASFQFEIDADDFLTVQFTNFSQNATSFDWSFGDGNVSSDESPSNTYAEGGTYTVTLTAANAEGETSERSETITIIDPNSAMRILTGTSGKTWKLFRDGVSMSVGPNADDPGGFWPGLTNDGSRPCLYTQEFTFNPDGSYVFDDMGEFWAEFGVFNNVPDCGNVTPESCFEATAGNMVNACGDDVSAWLSGTHSFDFDPSTGSLTLSGLGAWIGIPKLGTSGEFITPQTSVSAQITITEDTGFDVMLVEFIYDGVYWPIRYASYSDASLEPELVTEAEPPAPFGEDLPDATPESLSINFMAAPTSDLDSIQSGSLINYGAVDPADAAATCGEFLRTATNFQELQMQTIPEKNDIQFANMSTITLDVYLPSSNEYSDGGLTRNVVIGLADKSATEQWWTDHIQYEIDGTTIPLDEWTTVTFDLNNPSFVANPGNGATPFERDAYDMIFINIGGGNHPVTGTFFVRNFVMD